MKDRCNEPDASQDGPSSADCSDICAPSSPYAPFPPFPPYPPYPPFPPSVPEAPHAFDAGEGSREDLLPHESIDAPDGEPHDDGGALLDGTEEPSHPDGGLPPHGSSSTSDVDGVLPLPPRISVRRPDDFLVFDLSFFGFIFRPGPPRIERIAADAGVIVEFPPQSFGEQAYLETAPEVSVKANPPDKTEVTLHPGHPNKNLTNDDETPPTELPAARVRMSGPSRVALSMPNGATIMNFDLAAVLDALRSWPMRLDYNAVADPSSMRFTETLDPLLSQIEKLHGTAMLSPFTQTFSTTSSAAPATTPADELLPQIVNIGSIRPLLMGPHELATDVTSLELPYRVTISPLEPASWRHSVSPVQQHGRTELWHTRLSTSDSEIGSDGPSRIRALWSPDYRPQEEIDELIQLITVQPEPNTGPAPNPDLLRMSLDPVDRSMLVTLMSGFDATRNNGHAAYKPLSSEAKRLHLSALGALLEAEGTWTTLPDGVDLQQWQHLATLGRDHHVRVMYGGFLCPFGHAASLVKVTERKFESLVPGRPGKRVALLRQRFFIVVREPVRTYTGARHEFHGNNFPFKRIEILTHVTPTLAEPGDGASAFATSPSHGLAPRMLFWPMLPGEGQLVDFLFQIAATGIDGVRTTFPMPLLFVGKLADDKATLSKPILDAYNSSPAKPKRYAATGAAVVAYAPFDATAKADTQLPTRSITFRASAISGSPRPGFYPEIDSAEVGVKPLQKLLSQPNFVVEVTYPEFYKKNAFNPATNAAQIFLKLTKGEPLRFGGGPSEAKSDALGALASPQMNVLALSRTIGPVGGKSANDRAQVESALDTITGGRFDPLQFFDDAKILGGISLRDILNIRQSLAGTDVPRMLTQDVPGGTDTSFYWSTDVDGTNSTILIAHADPSKPPTRLTMEGVVHTPTNPAQAPTVESNASLNNFKVNLFGSIVLWFEQLVFVAKSGRKPDVTVEMREGEDAVQFGGPLEFVNSLRRYIPSNGFSDPPALLVTPSGISASYSLTLPAIEVGVFTLSNLSLGAAFSLPFDSKPASVRFNFSDRHQPFSLTVSLLGGGGFFAIGVTTEGVREIEAALEFGAVIAINLGVASGSVEVKAGIYFHWLEPIPGKGSVELAGYVRIHGELSVLAIISVSLTFNLQLGYLEEGGKAVCYGEATLTVEIDILMFSASVSVSCRREFEGGQSDPKFIDLVPTQAIWNEYCEAFASEAGM